MSCNKLTFLNVEFRSKLPYFVPTLGPDGGWTFNGIVQSQINTREYFERNKKQKKQQQYNIPDSPLISLVKAKAYH